MKMGTPIKCKNCGFETEISLKKGVQLKNFFCVKCKHTGFKRNTYYDKGEERVYTWEEKRNLEIYRIQKEV